MSRLQARLSRKPRTSCPSRSCKTVRRQTNSITNGAVLGDFYQWDVSIRVAVPRVSNQVWLQSLEICTESGAHCKGGILQLIWPYQSVSTSAGMAELADAADSKSAGTWYLGGSTPPPGTSPKAQRISD